MQSKEVVLWWRSLNNEGRKQVLFENEITSSEIDIDELKVIYANLAKSLQNSIKVREEILQILESLTDKESMVLNLLMSGMTTDQICQELNKSKGTVQRLRSSVHNKFGTRTLIGLITNVIKNRIWYSGFIFYKGFDDIDPSQLPQLTEREEEVLKLILQGYKQTDIVEKLNRSIRTIQNIRYSIRKKWKIENDIDLIRKSIVCGVLIIEFESYERDF